MASVVDFYKFVVFSGFRIRHEDRNILGGIQGVQLLNFIGLEAVSTSFTCLIN